MRYLRTFSLALLGLSCHAMYADTLASYAPAGYTNLAPNYLGEAFAISGTGTFNNITFNFLTQTGANYAIGTGFLLSQAYTGAPGTLSSATAGYLGSAAASGNVYTFANSLMLTGGSTYYFYENAVAPTNSIGGGPTTTALPQTYYATSTGNFIAQPGSSDAFRATGSAVATSVTPEPSSFILLATGTLVAAGTLRRRLLA